MDIVVLLDGTWNDLAVNTNVCQIYRRLGDAGDGYRCGYIEGVGSKRFERLRGGITGYGLDDNIREGYRFVAKHYRSDDDRIFLIGYSRGAFTARSLAGMIAKCGIVDPSRISDKELFERYRDSSAMGLREMRKNPGLAVTALDKKVLAESRLARIRFVGVFDTVGSLGIPTTLGRWLTRRRYEFHDTKLSGLVDYAYHAIAIDERRKQFAPTLWTEIPKPIPGHPTTVEQRWFVGVHGSVGGGGTDQPDERNPLSALTREWIVEGAAKAGLAITSASTPAFAWRGAFTDSRRGFWRILGSLPGNGAYLRPVRTTTVAETLDESVRHRWRWGAPPYQPKNPNLAEWVKNP
ncbi:DUF2235 domain-containing protein [Actinophytocola sp. NPDC049390]|uniref:DUF2235 domain-containing protein n=1 Tax=Actinophytocola sp. NPDC049390 TaxID=3363894 RepID=UPI0037A838DB